MRIFATLISLFLFAAASVYYVPGQSNQGTAVPLKKANKRKPAPLPVSTPPIDEDVPEDSGDEILIETKIVTIPVKVLDRNGRFVAGLRIDDFTVLEDDKAQEIAFFANEELPFTVALVLDMSYSSVFKIDEIQQAALQFVTELRPEDRVMVVAFDGEVLVLSEVTSDRKQINSAILRTRIGSGTSVYDAVDLVLNNRFEKIEGRKAVVLFTDGVDTTSRRVTDRDNLRDSLESEVIVFPVRYNTFEDVQAMQQGRVSVSDRSLPRTTAPIGGGSVPGSSAPIPFPLPTGTIGGSRRGPGRSIPGDGTSVEEYERAAQYLDELAIRTGGRLYQAENNRSLSSAFSQIASELREFYSLGYYPEDGSNTSRRRKIKVKVNRDRVSVQARRSYVLKPKSPSTDAGEKN